MISRSRFVLGSAFMAVVLAAYAWLWPARSMDGATEAAGPSLLAMALGVVVGLVLAPALVALLPPKPERRLLLTPLDVVMSSAGEVGVVGFFVISMLSLGWSHPGASVPVWIPGLAGVLTGLAVGRLLYATVFRVARLVMADAAAGAPTVPETLGSR